MSDTAHLNTIAYAEFYVVFRRRIDDGVEFMDYRTLSPYPDFSLSLAKQEDEESPNWARKHPIERVGKVIVKEVEAAPAQAGKRGGES